MGLWGATERPPILAAFFVSVWCIGRAPQLADTAGFGAAAAETFHTDSLPSRLALMALSRQLSPCYPRLSDSQG